MDKKSLKKLVKTYFADNNRMMGIFIFVFVLMLLMSMTLFRNEDGTSNDVMLIALLVSFLSMLLVIFAKVWIITFKAKKDINNQRFIKKNVKFAIVKEDKSWILWNSNPKNATVCKYLAYDEEGNEYRLCTTCNYQNVAAVEKFLSSSHFRVVQLEKSKMIICIQFNPADFKNKKESNEVAENTKLLFGVFSYSFSYKND